VNVELGLNSGSTKLIHPKLAHVGERHRRAGWVLSMIIFNWEICQLASVLQDGRKHANIDASLGFIWRLSAQMVQRIVFMSAALLLGLLGDVRGATAQSCVIQTPRYSLKADTVDWSIKIASGKSCARGVRFGNVEIEAVKLVSPPSSGQVTVEGPGFRYTSKANYKGRDSFSLAVVGRIKSVRGNSTIHVTVAVGESTAASDVTSPSVTFTTPSNGSTVSGASITLTATASDNVAVANVRFFVDGVAIGSPVTASPYTITWDCTGMPDGPHRLDAFAQDTSGNSATSSINITVENIGP
jgi:hypothetical protein